VGDEDDSGKLVGVKAGPVELELGAGLPKALAMLFPGWAAKRHAKAALLGKLIEKACDGRDLDDAEVLYATEALGEDEAKFIRRRQIQQRALAAYQAQEAKQLPASTGGGAPEPAGAKGSKSTPDDWVNKFWEDAGLVDDEMLQELYGRVLASEARSPGACSLRTLRALRYMDRETAEDFAKLASLVFDEAWVPAAFEVLARFGAPGSVLMNLVDAGLLAVPGSNIMKYLELPRVYYRCGASILSVHGMPQESSFNVVPLTTAGIQLCKIAQVNYDATYALQVAAWLRSVCDGIEVSSALVPDVGWDGRAESLRWQSVPG
jgi:hypothetical protein